jgi:hypothetical protein
MEAAGGSGGRPEMERSLIERSPGDEAFRRKLLADPRAAVEEELGMRLPESVRVRAVEESAQTIYLVIPSASPIGEGGELSDEALESVAGGWDPIGSTSSCSGGGRIGCW